ncbi:MAG: energy transducer TonB, partial [Flavobacteriales bacterium]|nr:energy transducer TonB [Flavobacteriales bacterium]
NINVKRSAHAELDKIAIETINKMPNWEPAEKEGKKVSSIITLPIKFLPTPPSPPTPPSAPTPPKPVKAPQSGFIPTLGLFPNNKC